jgi:hypothetical protein
MTRISRKIEEDIHHQIDVLQDKKFDLTTVNSKLDKVLRTKIEKKVTTIEIKIVLVAITDMETNQEEMKIGDVTLIKTIRTENKIIL